MPRSATPPACCSPTSSNLPTGVDQRVKYVAAAGVGASVSVTTAGGTSAAVVVEMENSPALGSINDLAIFPPGSADAGRYLVADGTATLRVLDAVTLEQVRTIAAWLHSQGST